ncbi:hypothetical protein RYH73_19440 [Olivibacter sp. CPCC 100613]|uniref:TlpA family protein disulfide reductase n=1 Tax=Olivibacter sp. CPCC 100613 TaxID=3079931 RepID=UPI002FF98CDE
MRKKVIFSFVFALGILLGLRWLFSSLFNSSEEIYFDPRSEQYQGLDDIIKNPKFKDKLLYIDIWGTRCVPCIKEFPDSKKLSEYFKDNNKVAFIYLCSPYNYVDDQVRWRFFAKKYELSGHHIFLTEQAYFEVYKKIEGNTKLRYLIPRYVIAKNGKILMPRAPSPSASKQTIEALKSYL